MFTFERIGCEPELYMEDYAINYSDNGEPFIINDYYDDEGDQAIIPVISIDRQRQVVDLYEFAYADAKPSDKPKIIKVILQLVELKDILQIEGYCVVGEGAVLFDKIYHTLYIK